MPGELLHINRMEMRRVRNRKHKIQHRPFLSILLRIPILLKHPTPIRKRISDRGVELGHDTLQQRAGGVVHREDLVLAEAWREFGERRVPVGDGRAGLRGESVFRGRVLGRRGRPWRRHIVRGGARAQRFGGECALHYDHDPRCGPGADGGGQHRSRVRRRARQRSNRFSSYERDSRMLWRLRKVQRKPWIVEDYVYFGRHCGSECPQPLRSPPQSSTHPQFLRTTIVLGFYDVL